MRKSELRNLIRECIEEEEMLSEDIPTGKKTPYTEGGFYQDLTYVKKELLPKIKYVIGDLSKMAAKISKSPNKHKMDESAINNALKNLKEAEKQIRKVK